jgi:hypothetical protein
MAIVREKSAKSIDSERITCLQCGRSNSAPRAGKNGHQEAKEAGQSNGFAGYWQ